MRTDRRVMAVLADAKRVACEYYALTGKPLGITGDVAEYEAARVLDLELTAARQTGCDAIERVDGFIKRLQIKGRYLQQNSRSSAQLGSIRCEHDWDAVLMVLLDRDFEAFEIYVLAASRKRA